MPAAFEELVGSPEVLLDDGRFRATRRFKVAWADTLAFTRDLVGAWSVVDGALSYTPAAYFPGVPQAVCRTVRFEPFPETIQTGSSSDLITSTNQPYFALVTASYAIADHANLRQTRADRPSTPEGTLLTVGMEIGSEELAVPGRTFHWPDNQRAGDQHVGIYVPVEQLTCRWERVPLALVPWNAIRDLRGKLNQAAFFNHAAETVRFLGAQLGWEFQFAGDVLCRLDYRFSVREVPSAANPATHFGWNHFYRDKAVAGEHWQTLLNDSEQKVYATGNFNQLFQFAA